MSSNFLSLHPSNTEFLIFGLPHQLTRLNNPTIHLPMSYSHLLILLVILVLSLLYNASKTHQNPIADGLRPRPGRCESCTTRLLIASRPTWGSARDPSGKLAALALPVTPKPIYPPRSCSRIYTAIEMDGKLTFYVKQNYRNLNWMISHSLETQVYIQTIRLSLHTLLVMIIKMNVNSHYQVFNNVRQRDDSVRIS